MKVVGIGMAYVKATQLISLEECNVLVSGIEGDRDFIILEQDDTPVSPNAHGAFFPIRFEYCAQSGTLAAFRDGTLIVEGELNTGAELRIDYLGMRDVTVCEVLGPWHQLLSEVCGRPVRLFRSVHAGGLIDVKPITFFTVAALRRLERELGHQVDPTRFRANFVIDGCDEDFEANAAGRTIELGSVKLLVSSAVPRCVIPGFNPMTGVRDQNIMRGLTMFREKVALPDGLMPGYAAPGFATYAEVLEPGKVAIGDEVRIGAQAA